MDVRDHSFIRKGVHFNITDEDPEKESTVDGVQPCEIDDGSSLEGLKFWAEQAEKHRSFYLVPNFLAHFDFSHIRSHEALHILVPYQALQLGFELKFA